MSILILLVTAASAKRLLQQTIGGVPCGGFENCASYFDGCNSCTCGGAFSICQQMFCAPANYTDAYCESCVDGFTANDLGVCEEDATATTEPAPCGGFENCASYFDGCNTCSCGGLLQQCTFAFCDEDNMGEPYCAACEDGYALSATGSGLCEPIITTTEEPCGGFDNCASYFDGCNTCSCGGLFQQCTFAFCDEDNLGEPYCAACEDGYALSATGSGLCEPIDITTTAQTCGGFDNCVAYNDGCNSCNCGGLFSYCTEMACETYADAYCTECADGFALADTGLCVEDVPETTNNVNVSMCGGFENCASYYDGCNSCGCGGTEGSAYCTEMFCEPYDEAYCTGCADGFALSAAGLCVDAGCGGFAHCTSYNNGCQDCVCDSDTGSETCADWECFAWNDPVCIECEEGYVVNDAGECVGEATSAEDTVDYGSSANTVSSMVAFGFVVMPAMI